MSKTPTHSKEKASKRDAVNLDREQRRVLNAKKSKPATYSEARRKELAED